MKSEKTVREAIGAQPVNDYGQGFKDALEWVLTDRVMLKGVILFTTDSPGYPSVAIWNEGMQKWSVDGEDHLYATQQDLENRLGDDWEVLREF